MPKTPPLLLPTTASYFDSDKNLLEDEDDDNNASPALDVTRPPVVAKIIREESCQSEHSWDTFAEIGDDGAFLNTNMSDHQQEYLESKAEQDTDAQQKKLVQEAELRTIMGEPLQEFFQLANQAIQEVQQTSQVHQDMVDQLKQYRKSLHERGIQLQETWEDLREHGLSITRAAASVQQT
ncbi:hypothetical protein BX666DRAFT_2031481 [Dichotomocladium elegans]|nr:hypothetical protein BX666DRAFT_2031481 [Dichotomocladium elegans]